MEPDINSRWESLVPCHNLPVNTIKEIHKYALIIVAIRGKMNLNASGVLPGLG